MRAQASVLHLDLDAFFASVEQRDKPSLRGKPVVVGGVGGRGVVATASYEARRYGVRSAMSTREARARCPHAAFLTGRFHAYREASTVVMALLRAASPLVEPLSLDEAFVDLEAADLPDLEVATVSAFAEQLRRSVAEATGGLTASVGLGSSKFIAKVASDLDKPDGLVVVPPGTEQELLRPMSVTVIPGVGPATTERLRRVGIQTVADLESMGLDELVRLVGKAHGTGLYALSRAQDDRPVEPEREAKSISNESTFDTDLTDRTLMEHLLTKQAADVAARLRKHGLSGRTVTIKVRLHDFTTLNRSTTLASPTDSGGTVARLARGLLADLDTSGGVRLLGVGVSGLADWIQEDLFGETEEPEPEPPPAELVTRARDRTGWYPGLDVLHDDLGRGWVWGAGRGVVTVRFETAATPAGPVRSFQQDDPALHHWLPDDPDAAPDTASDAAPDAARDGADAEPVSGPGPAVAADADADADAEHDAAPEHAARPAAPGGGGGGVGGGGRGAKRVATDDPGALASSTVEIRELAEPALGDDAVVAELFAVAERSGRLGREAMPFWGLTEFTAHLRSPDSGERKELVAAYDGERLLGFATLWLPLHDNLDKAYFELAVDPAARRRGVGTALVEEVTARARAAERTLLLVDTKVPPGERETHGYRRFADALGFEYSNVEVVRHLPLPVAAETLQSLADQAGEKSEGYTIEVLVDEIPADLEEPLGLLMGQLGVDAPTGLVDFEEESMTPERLRERQATVTAMGRSLFEAVALTPERVVAAHSTLAVPLEGGTDVYQWGTFVHRDHRGHRLGLATKVANLQAVQARYPHLQRVTTQNAESNDYMVSINVTLGFVPVEESVEFLKRI